MWARQVTLLQLIRDSVVCKAMNNQTKMTFSKIRCST